MKNRPYLFFIKSAQTNYQSFFCLLFFPKKSTVPIFLFKEKYGQGAFSGVHFKLSKPLQKAAECDIISL